MKFRKKPVEIEAVQFDGNYRCLDIYPLSEVGQFKVGVRDNEKVLLIPTLEGEMTARKGDWIIRGVHGEYYPCKPDIFAETYDPV